MNYNPTNNQIDKNYNSLQSAGNQVGLLFTKNFIYGKVIEDLN